MQPAGLLVQVAQSGGQARDVAGAVERPLGGADRLGHRRLEGDEALIGAPVRGEVEQRLLGVLHLAHAVQFRLGAEGVVDHHLADVDELAAQPGIVDRAAIFAGVDDAHHRGQQLRQVGGAADLLQHAGMLELGFQRNGVGELAGLGAALDGGVDAAVDRVGEMLRQQELGDALIGEIVGQQRAEQRLLGGQVGGRQALAEAEQRGGRERGVHAGSMIDHRLGAGLVDN